MHVATVPAFVLALFTLPAAVAADDLGQSVGSVIVPDGLKKVDLFCVGWSINSKTGER